MTMMMSRTTIMILNYHHRMADTHHMPDWVSVVTRISNAMSPNKLPTNFCRL